MDIYGLVVVRWLYSAVSVGYFGKDEPMTAAECSAALRKHLSSMLQWY